MNALAVVLPSPREITVQRVTLDAAGPADVVVEVHWSGISTGTERLLFTGEMPPFPGMGYPLVPGYETVGRILGGTRDGEWVFVPGARCFGPIHALFGATASRLVVPGARALAIGDSLRERGTLLALAATARHALAGHALPDLIVGHGALGRLLARLAILDGAAPVVWEANPARRSRADYPVIHPDDDTRRNYRAIYDASGDSQLLDQLIARLAPGGEIVLAGFYAERPSFAFPPAFMRELRLRVAAQWQPEDLVAVRDLAAAGSLGLDDLITHHAAPAADAYRTAFSDPDCLKMILQWKELA